MLSSVLKLAVFLFVAAGVVMIAPPQETGISVYQTTVGVEYWTRQRLTLTGEYTGKKGHIYLLARCTTRDLSNPPPPWTMIEEVIEVLPTRTWQAELNLAVAGGEPRIGDVFQVMAVMTAERMSPLTTPTDQQLLGMNAAFSRILKVEIKEVHDG